MSSDLAISVRNLFKEYVIAHEEKHTTLGEKVLARLKNPLHRPKTERFLALNDVSFDVKKGEVIGIIGRNGAGKSTLLKVLSRITEPHSGEVKMYGRVASLLEVGTGFHPELTGRENIFLNGAILGMSRAEIRKHFDAIVDFAEVEMFLDTPVKRYSSGMYVRLAFAVAAHLNPEMLIVDEVLAVGDGDFQKKCLGKMQDVSREEGRTVLFVSHNMLAIQKLCTRAILLRGGQLHASGHPSQIVADYLSTAPSAVFSRSPSGTNPQITGAKLITAVPRTDGPIEIHIEWHLPETLHGVKVGVGFNTPDGQRIFDCAPEDLGLKSPHEKGFHNATFRIPANTLLARNYAISVGVWRESVPFDHVLPALSFAVEAAPTGPYSHESTREGLVNVACGWDQLG